MNSFRLTGAAKLTVRPEILSQWQDILHSLRNGILSTPIQNDHGGRNLKKMAGCLTMLRPYNKCCVLLWCRMGNKFRNLKPITGYSAYRLCNKRFVSTRLLLVSQEFDSLFCDDKTLQQTLLSIWSTKVQLLNKETQDHASPSDNTSDCTALPDDQ